MKMRLRARPTRRSGPGRLLVLLLMGLMVAAVACGRTPATSDPSGPPDAQSTQAPRAATKPPASTTASDATATEAPPTMGAATPVRLQIPAIGVDSDLMELALETDGTLQVPPSGFPAGWFTGAPTPGELGPAIIAGHVDWGGEPGVFFDLQDLTAGDEIAVAREDGSTAQFRIDHVERFDKDEFPTQRVYGDLEHAGLRLITCGGDFDRQTRSYEDNIVVFASLVDGR